MSRLRTLLDAMASANADYREATATTPRNRTPVLDAAEALSEAVDAVVVYFMADAPDSLQEAIDAGDDDVWLERAADVKVGDTITTLFSDTGEATVVGLHRVPNISAPGELICAELDNGRHTHLGGDDDVVEVIRR